MATKSNGNHPASAGAAIYVDTENLREPDLAQDVIAQTVADWPAEYPPVGSVSLYVRADKVALWRMWLEATYPELARRVRGVQHFSREMAKNSADLAITADAIGDLAAGQAGYIAVISNDSDFGALFVKVREMALDAGWERVPFLWITAPGGGAISPEIERFIPDRFRWNLPNASRPNPVPTWTQTPARPPAVTRNPSAQAPAAQAPAGSRLRRGPQPRRLRLRRLPRHRRLLRVRIHQQRRQRRHRGPPFPPPKPDRPPQPRVSAPTISLTN